MPANDTEKQQLDLMTNYAFDMGAGYHKSMQDRVTALSASFSLAYLLGGLINFFLASKKAWVDIVQGIVGINLGIFGVGFVLMVVFTFLPPIMMTGLVFTSLLFTWFKLRKSVFSRVLIK